MFERAAVIAKEISDGEVSPELLRDTERILARAVLGLQARVEELEETNDRLYRLCLKQNPRGCAI